MAFTLLLRRSSVPGHQPTTAQLNVGELSMNSNDGILYFMQQNSTTLANTIVSIAPSTYLTSMVASGDVSGTSSGNAITLTLASVGTAGTYSAVITDAKGRVTGSTALTFTGDATGSGSGASIALTLATVATAGTFAVTTFNAKGLVTSGANLVATGDATGTSSGTGLALTLATVNTTPGTFGTATIIPTITVNGKGLVTSISNTAITGVGLLGYTPLNAANASVTVTGAATGTASFAGSNNVSVALTLAASGVTAGTYSSVTVSSTGLVTAGGNITASGDATGTVAGTALALTLATVNSNIGSFGSNTAVATFTVNAKGLVTAAGSTAINVVSALGYTPVNNAIVGVANGIATLNSSGQLTASQIPASIVGAVVYQGTWNASTNTPTLTSSTGTKGWYYKVSVAGSTTVDGISTWNIGDTIIFDGTTWDKIDGIAAEVLSFNTRTGAITLTSSDVTTALGFTPQGAIVVTGDVSGTATQNAITLTLANVATAGTFAVTTFNAKGLVTSGANLVATGDATGTSSGSGLALTLASSGATAGVYGSATQIPTITVNAKGLVTSISNTAITGVGLLGFTPLNQANASVTLAGDATGTASFAGTNAVTVTTTLATVNTNVGTFTAFVVNGKGLVTAASNMTFTGDATGTAANTAVALTLATVNSNVGAFGGATVVPAITVNAKGLITAVTATNIAFPVTSVFGRTGAVVLQSSDVTTALGYTPQGNAIVVTGDVSGTSTQNALTLTLANVTTAGTYTAFVVNAKGLVTSGLVGNYSGDATGTSSGANTVLTLATVNSNVGVFGGATNIPTITVNGKGLITSISNTAITGVGLLGYTPLNQANASVTLTGDTTGSATFSGNAVSVATTLASVGTAGTYSAVITDTKGRVTGSTALTFTGDATGSGAGASIALTLAASGVTAGTYAAYVVNAKGLITSGANLVATGDAAGTSSGSGIALTLAASGATAGTYGAVTVNAKGLVTAGAAMVFSGDASGTSANATTTLTLATVNVTPGTYGAATIIPTIVVNGKGLVTSISNTAITGVGLLGYTPLNAANASVTLSGAVTGTASFAGSNAVSVTTTLAASGVTAGTYSAVIVNAQGLVTGDVAATLTGDVTGSSFGASIATTLATVNSNVGTFVGITVNAKGLVTAAANVVTFAGYNLGVGLGPDVIDGGSF